MCSYKLNSCIQKIDLSQFILQRNKNISIKIKYVLQNTVYKEKDKPQLLKQVNRPHPCTDMQST